MPNTSETYSKKNGWYTFSEVTTLEGISRQAARKRYLKWITLDSDPSKAIQVPGNGGAQWKLHVSALSPEAQLAHSKAFADERLCAAIDEEIDRQTDGPRTRWEHATVKDQQEALKRQRLVRAFREVSGQRERHLFAVRHKVALRSLYNWSRDYNGAPSSLLYARSSQAGLPATPTEVVETAIRLYLAKQSRTGAMAVAATQALCDDKGWPRPHRATIYRWLSDANIVSPRLVTLAKRGKKAYQDTCEHVETRDWHKRPVNDVWIGDHHQFDVVVIREDMTIGRLWVTDWIEGNSRAIMGYFISKQPNSDTIALALKNGVVQKADSPLCGKPASVYVDNGKDYRSKGLNGETVQVFSFPEDMPIWGLFGELGIVTHFATKYSARSKATKERHYGTMESLYLTELPGYCGNKPENRPDELKERIAKTKAWLKSGGAQGDRLLLWQWQFEALYACYVNQYNNREHQGIGKDTPIQRFSDGTRFGVTTLSPEALDILTLRPKVKQIQNCGIDITYDAPHETVRFWADELSPLIGESVEIRYTPYDRSYVVVLKNKEFVCKAPRLEGANPFAETDEDRARARNLHQQRAEDYRGYMELLKGIKDPVADLLLGLREPNVTPFKAPEGRRQRTRYDKAAEQAALGTAPKPHEAMAVAEATGKVIYAFEYQKRRAEQDQERSRP